MGTQTSYPIGTILTRKKKQDDENDELRVIGGGKQLVVTPNAGFGANFSIDADEVRKDYTTDIPASVYLAQPTYVDPGPSPEEVFSGESAPGDGLSRLERYAAQEAQGARVDTGVPTQRIVGTSEPQTAEEQEAAVPAKRERKPKEA